MPVNWQNISKVYQWAKFDHFSHCLLCDQPAGRALPLCGPCEADLPWLNGPLCPCGLPRQRHLPCPLCQQDPLPVTAVHPCFRYAFPVDRLIRRYKHGFELAPERLLEQLWCRHLAQQALAGPVDALVPVPLHWRRQWWRGFNQAARLAAALSRCHQWPLHPLLVRPRGGQPQQGLSRQQRQQAPDNLFRCRRRLDGQHLALVDDVVTTGATVRRCARALLDAGAGSVTVLCLARALPPAP